MNCLLVRLPSRDRPRGLTDLAACNRPRLQAICRELGVRGYSRMTREVMQRKIMELLSKK